MLRALRCSLRSRIIARRGRVREACRGNYPIQDGRRLFDSPYGYAQWGIWGGSLVGQSQRVPRIPVQLDVIPAAEMGDASPARVLHPHHHPFTGL